MNAKQMQKQIMRRVYYSYTISIAAHSMMWRGMFLGAASVLLAQWLHVASIFNNFLSVPVGSVPSFVSGAFINAATHGEFMTVVVVVVSAVVGATCLYRVLQTIHLERFFIQPT